MSALTSPLLLAAALSAVMPPTIARAHEPPPEPPTILMLRLAAAREAATIERRLFNELGLVLDDFALISAAPPSDDFERHALTEQLGEVHSLVEMYGATAVVWITQTSDDLLLLSLVAVDTGRTFARLVTLDNAPTAAARLALAVRELLGTAYLFEENVATQPEPVQQVVSDLRSAVAKDAAPPPPAAASRWGAALGVVSASPLSRHRGPGQTWGLALTTQLRIRGDAFAGLELLARQGPARLVPERSIDGWGARASALAAYRWQLGAFRAGPVASAGVDWWHAAVQLGAAPTRVLDVKRLVLGLGGQIDWRFSDVGAVTLGIRADYFQHRVFVHRRSTGLIELSSPAWEWSSTLGFQMNDDRGGGRLDVR